MKNESQNTSRSESYPSTPGCGVWYSLERQTNTPTQKSSRSGTAGADILSIVQWRAPCFSRATTRPSRRSQPTERWSEASPHPYKPADRIGPSRVPKRLRPNREQLEWRGRVLPPQPFPSYLSLLSCSIRARKHKTLKL